METQANSGSESRTYGCPVEATLEIVSGKWKCVVLWWLRQGEKRFSELMALMPSITRKVLTTQLRELEIDGLIRRETFKEKPPRVEYFLTEKGESLRPLMELMCEWGKQQLPGFEFGILKLSGLRVLALTATASTAEALETVLATTCGADITLKQFSEETQPSTNEVIELFNRLDPMVVIVEFGDKMKSMRRLMQHINQPTKQQADEPGSKVVAIALTHNATERSQAFSQGFRLTFSNPFELDELVGAIAGLTNRL